jgi:murein DD-endopeptidase MepM/ murein hydrolase activator NlpD
VRKKIQPEFYIENEFMLPVRGMKKEKLYFGDLRKIRIGGRNGGHYYHRGIDYGAPTGTRVYASNAGKIVLARRLFKRGKTVILNHGGGISTEYLHLSRIHVKAGQMVKKGQVIGRVGNTGISTGPHLHWSFVVNGILVNPLPFIETSVASLFGSFPVSSIAEKRGRTGAGKAN